MKNTLKEIIQYIKNGHYKNEENIRFSLIGRILKKIGWDIWNPKEVATEFIAVPEENEKGKVDIALIGKDGMPFVYIEIKALGKLQGGNIVKGEIQLRDYNKNNTALFAILTDGQIWRFYYPQSRGTFSQKHFKTINLLKDDLDDIELNFDVFLSKKKVFSGRAKLEAENYLKSSLKKRLMRDEVFKARDLTQSPPYFSLPKALIECVKLRGVIISLGEAEQFLKQDIKQNAELPKKIVKQQVIKTIHVEKLSCRKITFHKPKYFIFLNQQYVVSTWKGLLLDLCSLIAKKHSNEHNKFLKLYGRKNPYFSYKKDEIPRSPQKIKNSIYYVETGISGKDIIQLCNKIILLFGYKESDFSFSSAPK